MKTKSLIFALIVTIGGFIFGLDAALISGTVGYVTEQFDLASGRTLNILGWETLLDKNRLVGLFVSSPGWGVLLALFASGWICNRFGRKKALLLIAALYLISAVCSAFAPSYWALVAARFLGGLAFASITLAAMYIGEIAPAEWRGKLVSMNQINIVIGLSAAYFINYLIKGYVDAAPEWAVNLGLVEQPWRFMLGSEILPALAWLILLCFIPESPRWLVYRSRQDEAKQVMARLMPESQIEPQLREMETSLREDQAQEEKSILAQFFELFSPRMRVASIVALTIAIAQQISGINAILFYAPTVFEQLGGGTDAAFTQSVWVGLVSIVFTVFAVLLVDRLGRRPLIVWGLVWVALSHGICYYGFSQARYTLTAEASEALPTEVDRNALAPVLGKEYKSDIDFKAALSKALGEAQADKHAGEILQQSASMNAGLILFGILSFIAAFHFSIGPIMWVLFSEIFPTSLRGVAIPVFAFITSVVSVLVQFLFPMQLAAMGASSVFLFYAITAVIGLIPMFIYLPETKNLSIEEISRAFAGDKS